MTAYRIVGYDVQGRVQYDDRRPPADLDAERERCKRDRPGAVHGIVRYESELLTANGWVRYSPRESADSFRRFAGTSS